MYLRTGTTRWINNAGLNGIATNAGPGVIQPPIKITFHKLGTSVVTRDNSPPETTDQSWGSFGNLNGSAASYPDAGPRQNWMTLRLRFWNIADVFNPVLMENRTWHFPVPIGGQATLQLSTNQTDWMSLATVTNHGAVIEWSHYGAANPPRFFRVLPP